MGKRKAAKKVQGPKKREPLSVTFTCLFCNHEHAIIVKLDKKLGLGSLHCKVCGQQFQTGINYLSAAVDVYSDWIDACEAVAKDENAVGDGEEEADAGGRIVGAYGSRGTALVPQGGDGDGEDDDEY